MQSTCLEASTRQLPHCQADISGVKYLLRSKYSPLDQRQVTSSCAKTHGQTPTASLGAVEQILNGVATEQIPAGRVLFCRLFRRFGDCPFRLNWAGAARIHLPAAQGSLLRQGLRPVSP